MIDIHDDSLFGNDAAEDEDESIFVSYAVTRTEAACFLDPERRICVARALRGEGKSALLRLTKTRLAEMQDAPLIISVIGSSIAPDIDKDDADALIRAWKKSIFSLIAREVGSQINMAWSDDAITLVEEAEQNGYKSRSVLSSIFDRLKSSKVPVERTRIGVANPEEILKRWSSRKDSVWIFVDDIDRNFKSGDNARTKVATFFLAIREISNLVPNLRFRGH